CQFAPGLSSIPPSGPTMTVGMREAGSAPLLDDLHEMRDLRHHAAHARRVGQLARPVHLVEAEPDQLLALDRRAADRRSDLSHDNGLCHDQASAVSAAGAGCSVRGRMSETFLPRRWATIRGLCSRLRPSIVARIML